MECIVKTHIRLKNDRIVTLQVHTWRLISLDSNCAEVLVHVDETSNMITNVTFDGLYQIEKGSQLIIPFEGRNYPFRVNHLIVENETLYLAETERNITTRFILPALKMNQSEVGLPYLINGYLYRDANDTHSGDYVYLCYRYIDTDGYRTHETSLKKNPLFMQMIEVDREHTLFKFKIPEIYQKSIQLITEGKYSQITEEYKRTILRYHKIGSKSDLGYILYRDPEAVKRLEEELGVHLTDEIEIFQKMKKRNETFGVRNVLEKEL